MYSFATFVIVSRLLLYVAWPHFFLALFIAPTEIKHLLQVPLPFAFSTLPPLPSLPLLPPFPFPHPLPEAGHAGTYVLMGVGGMACMQENILQLMPAVEKEITLTQVLQQATQLQATQLFKSNGEAGQRAISAATNVINQMACGKPPALGDNCTAFLARAKAACQFFVRHTNDHGEKLTGEKAILAKLKQLEVKGAEASTFADLEPVHVYYWLVPATHKKQVDAATKLILERTGKAFSSPVPGGKSAAYVGTGSGASKKNAKSSSSTDFDAAMSVFR